MRLLFFVALSFLAFAAQVCNGRPQINEDVTSIEEKHVISTTPTEFTQDEANDKDVDVSVVDALKDISKSLKEKFILLGDKIREKMKELKQAVGDNAQKIKAQLKNLKLQLKDSFRALNHQVQGFFNKGQYASLGDRAVEIFGKIVELQDRLKAFAKGVKHVTVDNLKKMKEVAKQLRKEIKMKVQELLHGSSDSQTALYHASDDDDEDSEAYVVATLKDISKALKEKFLVLVEQLKQKFAELKQVGRQQAEKIKEQIKILKDKVVDAREDVKQKVQELFKPAQYASFGENAMKVFAKVYNLREKLNKFLEGFTKVTGEKLEKLKELIKETRQEIKEKVQELIGSRSDTTALYHASDDDEEEKDNEVYVIATLKDLSKTLKEKFLILVEHLKQKFAELKEVGGQHAEKIKGQIKILKDKVAEARKDAIQKVQELFKPAQYASFGEHAMEVFAKLGTLREKLTNFLKEVKKVTGEKIDKLRKIIKETRQEIKEQVQDLIGSESDRTALYQASDADEDREAYIVDTLKDISKSLKEKFLVLGEKIAQKLKELKEATGERVAMLKKQLQELKWQLGEAAGAMKKKVLEMLQPEEVAQYGLLDGVPSAVSEKLLTLRNKLQVFLDNVQKLAGEKWIKMQEAIRELRNEIKQSIHKLLHGTTEVESTGAPAPASAMPPQYRVF